MKDPRTCHHADTEPVDVRSPVTGATETVARICRDCLEQLPAAWGCTDCEWVAERRLCDLAPRPLLAQPCKEHA